MKCPNCGTEVVAEEGYETIFRCPKCKFIGNRKDVESD
jgi:uncharacterized Zn finger protein